MFFFFFLFIYYADECQILNYGILPARALSEAGGSKEIPIIKNQTYNRQYRGFKLAVLFLDTRASKLGGIHGAMLVLVYIQALAVRLKITLL